MVKDEHIRVRVFVCDVLQTDLPVDRQLFDGSAHLVILRIVADLLVVDLFLQIVADSHKERLKVGDRGLVVVDPVHARQKPYRRHRQRGKLRHQIRHLRALQNDNDKVSDHPRYAHRLDQQPWRRVEDIVFLHALHIARAAFGVLVDEIIFLVRDLDLLDPHYRLFDPLVQTAVIVLVILSGLYHDRLEDLFDDQKQHQHQRRDHDRHLRVDRQQHQNQTQKDDTLAAELETAQDQSVHIVHIGGDASLDHGSIRVQIILIRSFHKVDHHPARGRELIRVYKFELYLLLTEQIQILNDDDPDKRQ